MSLFAKIRDTFVMNSGSDTQYPSLAIDLKSARPIDRSIHYPAFESVGLLCTCQTPTVTLACQAGKQFVKILGWSLV